MSSFHEPSLSAQLQTCSCRLSTLSQPVMMFVFFMLPQQEISGVIQDLKRVERQLLGVDVMQSVTHKYYMPFKIVCHLLYISNAAMFVC